MTTGAFSELIRCVACHMVYEQAVLASRQEQKPACPQCGETTWVAARVPLPEAAASIPA